MGVPNSGWTLHLTFEARKLGLEALPEMRGPGAGSACFPIGWKGLEESKLNKETMGSVGGKSLPQVGRPWKIWRSKTELGRIEEEIELTFVEERDTDIRSDRKSSAWARGQGPDHLCCHQHWCE